MSFRIREAVDKAERKPGCVSSGEGIEDPPEALKRVPSVAVVDDDGSVCRAFARLLRAAGFAAVPYPSAEAFLADTSRPRSDCMVFDVQLGGMSGIELAKQLAASEPEHGPIIFLTGHDDPQTRADIAAVGCAACFLKTASGEDVLETIHQLTASMVQADAGVSGVARGDSNRR